MNKDNSEQRTIWKRTTLKRVNLTKDNSEIMILERKSLKQNNHGQEPFGKQQKSEHGKSEKDYSGNKNNKKGQSVTGTSEYIKTNRKRKHLQNYESAKG